MVEIDPNEKVAEYRKEGIARIKLGVTDIDGVLRGKYISLDKFESIADAGSGFCDCVLGWDMDDQLYDNVSFTGWHTAFPDAIYRLDLASERRLSDEGNIPYFIGEFVNADGEGLHPICPRSRLKHVLELAAEMGFDSRLSFEYEFFIFNETAHSVREKNYRDLNALSPGNFGYSVLRATTESQLFNELMDYCLAHDFPLEGLHCETGPGVWEAAIAVDEALAGADKASLFKTFAKAFFQKREMIATFMAKWSMDYPGQSGHCHQSLYDRDSGANVFHQQGETGNMSDIMASYVAGQVKYLRPFLALCAPTINSYTRLVKGAWAPTAATWGIDNRTAALRVIAGTQKSQRVEFRVGAADGNPYLVAAANVGAGLLGIKERLKLPPPVDGNAYAVQDELGSSLQFPGSLKEAAADLYQSSEARALFGDAFIDHYVASREWEVREYEKAVNDWQLRRYFEII
jgi:glutamine synthetase|tara:strand:+ start:22 stop:1401 length:1380 start_codon:yes stop_codon:yes gene_type:complete